MKSVFRSAAVAAMLIPTVAYPQDFEAGWDAFEESDFAGALEEWLPLAAKGEIAAQGLVGIVYRDAFEDDTSAAFWLTRAAEQGSDEAMFNLGLTYADGEGELNDVTIARNWFLRAARQGHLQSMFTLAAFLTANPEYDDDYIRGHMWAIVASENDLENGDETRLVLASTRIYLSEAGESEAKKRAQRCIDTGYDQCD